MSKKIEQLEKRITKLEKRVYNLEHGEFINMNTSGDDFEYPYSKLDDSSYSPGKNRIALAEAVRLIRKHLKINFERIEEQYKIKEVNK